MCFHDLVNSIMKARLNHSLEDYHLPSNNYFAFRRLRCTIFCFTQLCSLHMTIEKNQKNVLRHIFIEKNQKKHFVGSSIKINKAYKSVNSKRISHLGYPRDLENHVQQENVYVSPSAACPRDVFWVQCSSIFTHPTSMKTPQIKWRSDMTFSS